MKIKKGDTVQVISGVDKGKQGEVLKVFPKDEKILVKGINIKTKYKKARSAQEQGGIVKQECPLYACKCMIVDPKTSKPTRVGYKVEGDKKVRIAKKSGQEIK